ncbi:hypothetical protein ROD_14431 [Citrobacter rodentium ICC168]|uniref:Uncharacterized protein n=1 Tax=Citrobacter rodentium (strain ICC168) TaxID=637910 RepID=D2THL2_CITRI|nr:hypothetical protein ROD_14431 [Citrobacter rodentium ICC168]
MPTLSGRLLQKRLKNYLKKMNVTFPAFALIASFDEARYPSRLRSRAETSLK